MIKPGRGLAGIREDCLVVDFLNGGDLALLGELLANRIGCVPAVKGDYHGNRTSAQQWEQVNGNVSKEHMKQRAVFVLNRPEDIRGFWIQNLPGTSGPLFRSA
jgi:hypothetical protein